MIIRCSIGSLAVLGLTDAEASEAPTTIYTLMGGGCIYNCLYCSQSASSRAKEYLSRVPWPKVSLEALLRACMERQEFKRICVQTVCKPGGAEELLQAVSELSKSMKPISVSLNKYYENIVRELVEHGCTRIGVGVDAFSDRISKLACKPFTCSELLSFASRINRNYVKATVHFIVGLGETNEEIAEAMKEVINQGLQVALFAFTPSPGTPWSNRDPPSLDAYRRVQALTYLTVDLGMDPYDVLDDVHDLRFREDVLRRYFNEILFNAFLTRGCPGCNRPFYNERPRGPVYNYPSRRMLYAHLGEERARLKRWLKNGG